MTSEEIKININDWLYYKKNVGVEGIHITGLPGTGKSNMANLLAWYCLDNGEHIILPGDRFCEWRHFEEYPSTCQLKVIIPSEKMCELKFHPEKLENKPYFIPLDSYRDLNIETYLKDQPPTVLVIYDACFNIEDRSHLWVSLTEQLINRFYMLDKAIGLLFHEAGNYWPEMARGKHWAAIDDFTKLFVDCRKGLVRPILISQLEAEVETRLRGKCMAKVHRKGWGSRKLPPALKNAIPFTPINQYQLQYGGQYVRYNDIDLFLEKKILYKIIPRHYINGDSLPNSRRQSEKRSSLEKSYSKIIKKLLEENENNKSIVSRKYGMSRDSIRKYGSN